jgi:membrane associated rhomboid family serine protease
MYSDPHSSASNGAHLTFAVQWLLILNVGIYFAESLFGLPLKQLFALKADWVNTLSAWQLVTYQFAHYNFSHLFSNMLGLFFLGPDVERALGTNRFGALYLMSGILGGFGWALLSPSYSACVGASGAVFGILGAYAALYPNRELVLLIFPFAPIKAWVLVLIFGAYELLQTLGGPGGAVANAAHLGGGIAGYIYALILNRPHFIQQLRWRWKTRSYRNR